MLSILEIRVELVLLQKSREIVAKANESQLLGDNSIFRSDYDSKATSGDYCRTILGLLHMLTKNLKMREKYWLNESSNKEEKSELDMLTKEISNCLKSFLTHEKDMNSAIITADIKFLVLKIESVCKRTNLLLDAYNHNFRKELIAIHRHFSKLVTNLPGKFMKSYFEDDVYLDVEKCVIYTIENCDAKLKKTTYSKTF